MVTRSRQIGVAVAAAVYFCMLRTRGSSISVSVFVPLLWFCGLVVGARWKLICWLLTRSRDVPPRSSEWGLALRGIVVATVVAAVVPGAVGAVDLFACAGAPTAIAYAGGRIGCWAYGCCGLRLKRNAIHPIPLQLFEAGLSALTACVLIVAWVAGLNPYLQCAAFVAAHWALRAYSYQLRREDYVQVRLVERQLLPRPASRA